MPAIPGFFSSFDQIEVGSTNFSRLLLNLPDKYQDFIKWNLAGKPANATLTFSKFNDSIITEGSDVFQTLRHHGRFGFDGWNNFTQQNGPLNLYYILRNEYLIRRYRQRKNTLDFYEGIDPYLLEEILGSLRDIANKSDTALALCQDIIKEESLYNVKHWSRGYEGPMAFLGATTELNSAGGVLQGFYKFPDSIGCSPIQEGDIVTNRAPVGLYASPSAAAEYCLRQMITYVDYSLPNYNEHKAIFARNIFFEIDLLEGWNIAPLNTPGGKEIMIRTGRYFKVQKIEESTINNNTISLIVSLQEIPVSQADINIQYRDFIDGEVFLKNLI